MLLLLSGLIGYLQQQASDVSFSTSEIALIAALLGGLGGPLALLWRDGNMKSATLIGELKGRNQQLESLLTMSGERNRALQSEIVTVLTTAVQSNMVTMSRAADALESTEKSMRDLRDLLRNEGSRKLPTPRGGPHDH